MLAFAAVHGEFHRVAVGAVKSLVAVKKGLDKVFAGLQIVKIPDGVAERVRVGDDYRLAGLPLVDVDAKDNLRFVGEADLIARFARRVAGEEEKESTVERCGAALFWKRNGELWSRCLRGGDLRSEER